jgi:hypothetical protein
MYNICTFKYILSIMFVLLGCTFLQAQYQWQSTGKILGNCSEQHGFEWAQNFKVPLNVQLLCWSNYYLDKQHMVRYFLFTSAAKTLIYNGIGSLNLKNAALNELMSELAIRLLEFLTLERGNKTTKIENKDSLYLYKETVKFIIRETILYCLPLHMPGINKLSLSYPKMARYINAFSRWCIRYVLVNGLETIDHHYNKGKVFPHLPGAIISFY